MKYKGSVFLHDDGVDACHILFRQLGMFIFPAINKTMVAASFGHKIDTVADKHYSGLGPARARGSPCYPQMAVIR